MVTLPQLQAAFDTGHPLEYECLANLNLYDSPELQSLATQAIAGRQLRLHPLPPEQARKIQGQAIQVCLCEDDYPGWLPLEDIDLIEVAEAAYQPTPTLSASEIQARIPQIIAYTQAAMSQPNFYLWGGTVGANYDCSGLIQAAFMVNGIWLPRDAYQQEDFVQKVTLEMIQPGDLIFFGTPLKATHVALHVGERCYIHSSGKAQGRNGIGIDVLSAQGDEVSRAYYQQFRSVGRVVECYLPRNVPA
ncbi:MAG: C40 family peptidase [Timaviella obliquedivisa GSE-PSE-MK23-08B]|jgi:cell wall-associated NlpC family hydrolase|nr:C40 family peptidase [Timaviella obliquedivisa GSE-PSE-MK23-08B]